MKPIALDVCCRKGGATRGLQRAGFYVIGVDIEDQPGYVGDEFILMDALRGLSILAKTGRLMHRGFGSSFRPDLIIAGPPCQNDNCATLGNRTRGLKDDHVALVEPVRELLDEIGIPYVIEQPTRGRRRIRRDLTLCMDMFKGDMPPPWVQRHRSFEINGFTVPQPRHVPHGGYVRGHRHGVIRSGAEAPYVAAYGKGGGKATVAEMQHAMDIPWMTEHFDLCEAIPPAYTEYIGRAFLNGQ